ncbi:LacI family transcriptional regulator [Arthrobacter sp. S1_S22]|uniref:LacI family DNA-binding transcriptional regulator n=1 Tax=Pseudarthrobacter sp. NKDBFgelt TaxID=3384443 RepID=UPI001686444A|nr:LacI family transcriptional regulator [Arthrobacter sp. S13_S34]MBD1593915.1 LacI family transcriptional regulator [Arthrobacter sp. S1_S22]
MSMQPGTDNATGKARSKPTIYDIARATGVNPSTVSRALNKPGRVSAKTQKVIQDAAEELQFQMNPYARALGTGRTETLGLILTDITNPTFFDIIRAAQSTAITRNYTMMIAESAESPATELKAALRMQATVDGLILASPRMDDDNIRMLARTKPLVVINREVEGVSCVVPDVNGGIGAAVRALAEQGHRKIAYLAGPQQSWMSVRRWEGVQEACDWSRLEAVRLETAKPTVDGGRRVAREVLSTGATAVMAYNDLLAIGLMQELQAAGVVVPDQVSIVGFDDIFGADFTTPPLTTVRSPLASCGTTAAALLLDMFDREPEEKSSLVHVETELIRRGSSGRLMPAARRPHHSSALTGASALRGAPTL